MFQNVAAAADVDMFNQWPESGIDCWNMILLCGTYNLDISLANLSQLSEDQRCCCQDSWRSLHKWHQHGNKSHWEWLAWLCCNIWSTVIFAMLRRWGWDTLRAPVLCTESPHTPINVSTFTRPYLVPSDIDILFSWSSPAPTPSRPSTKLPKGLWAQPAIPRR